MKITTIKIRNLINVLNLFIFVVVVVVVGMFLCNVFVDVDVFDLFYGYRPFEKNIFLCKNKQS